MDSNFFQVTFCFFLLGAGFYIHGLFHQPVYRLANIASDYVDDLKKQHEIEMNSMRYNLSESDRIFEKVRAERDMLADMVGDLRSKVIKEEPTKEDISTKTLSNFL